MSGRVLFIIGTGRVGGAERQLARLAEQLRKANWEVGVAFLAEGGPIERQLSERSFPTWVPRRSSRSGPYPSRLGRAWAVHNAVSSIRVVRRACREFRPDVVHAMLPTSVWLGLRAAPRRIRRVAGILGFAPPMSRVVSGQYAWQLRHAHRIVCNAQHLADEVCAELGIDRSKVEVISNGVDLPLMVADPGSQPPTVAMVANFHTYKGHDVLLQALPQVDSVVRVRLCGTGAELDVIRAGVTELGLSDCVDFVEPPADVAVELQRAQFLVHPSRTEGLPNAVLEAMAAGLPVIASEVGGIPTLVHHDDNGLLVPVGDAPALAAAISRLAGDPALRVQMGSASRRYAERFSWETCAERHASVYLAARDE